MQCLKRCFGYDDELEADRYVNQRGLLEAADPIINEDVEEKCCLGRVWTCLSHPKTVVRLALGAVNAVALAVTAVFTTRLFQEDEQYHTRALLFGTGFGIPITVLTGCVLPEKWATAVADWYSRWSFEGLQVLVAFYINAGCPIDGDGFWDTSNVPLAVKELAMMVFAGVSVSMALLSLRKLLFPVETAGRQLQGDEETVLQQDPPPLLVCEPGKNEEKWLIGEQLVKGALGGILIGIVQSGLISLPEALYLGYFLLSHAGGVAVGTLFSYLKVKVLANCPVQEAVVDKVERFANIVRIASLGVFFAIPRWFSFIPLGVISGVSKTISLHNFQRLTKNDETVTPFEWKRIDNIAKASFAALILAWYISGMTDKGLRPQDYANIITYLLSTAGSYPLTRWLAASFDPQNNSRFFNSLRFYFVNYSEALVLPYMLIRAAQNIGDDQKDAAWMTIAVDLVAWMSFGVASGNNRALAGIRSHRSPNDMPLLTQLTAWFILASKGKFR